MAEALRLHGPYMLRSTYNNILIMHTISKDLRIIWEAMLEGSKFMIDIRDVVVIETSIGAATKEFAKRSEDAENEKNWREAAKAQAERRSHLRLRTADCDVPALLKEATYFGLSGLEEALQELASERPKYRTVPEFLLNVGNEIYVNTKDTLCMETDLRFARIV